MRCSILSGNCRLWGDMQNALRSNFFYSSPLEIRLFFAIINDRFTRLYCTPFCAVCCLCLLLFCASRFVPSAVLCLLSFCAFCRFVPSPFCDFCCFVPYAVLCVCRFVPSTVLCACHNVLCRFERVSFCAYAVSWYAVLYEHSFLIHPGSNIFLNT